MSYREFVDSREAFDADWGDYQMYLDGMIDSFDRNNANAELDYIGFVTNAFNGLIECSVREGELINAGPVDEMFGV